MSKQDDSNTQAASGYDHQAAERQVQQRWAANGTFVATENSDKPKFYCLSMFP